jgi:NAD(P)H dehydrogenase (quinone)
MVRDVEAARRLLPSRTMLRVADYEDVEALERAFEGVDDLVLISSDGDADTAMRHHANAIDAAAAAGIRQITFTSIVDIDERSPFYYAPVYRDAERRLDLCGVPSTILRCGLYSDFVLEYWLEPDRLSGELVLPAGTGRVAPVSRDDVAAAVAAVAARPGVFGGTCTITGEEALDVSAIAAAYGRSIGGRSTYRACSTDEYLRSTAARLEDPWPHAFATLCASIAEDRYSLVSRDFAAITGRKPERFEDYLLRKAGERRAGG